jgi:hypothetical protein
MPSAAPAIVDVNARPRWATAERMGSGERLCLGRQNHVCTYLESCARAPAVVRQARVPTPIRDVAHRAPSVLAILLARRLDSRHGCLRHPVAGRRRVPRDPVRGRRVFRLPCVRQDHPARVSLRALQSRLPAPAAPPLFTQLPALRRARLEPALGRWLVLAPAQDRADHGRRESERGCTDEQERHIDAEARRVGVHSPLDREDAAAACHDPKRSAETLDLARVRASPSRHMRAPTPPYWGSTVRA